MTPMLPFLLSLSLLGADDPVSSPAPETFPKLQLIGLAELPATAVILATAGSPDGRWIIVPLGQDRATRERSWGFSGIALLDTRSGKLVWADENVAPGRTLPAFTADGTTLVWCEETGDGEFRTIRRDSTSGEKTVHPLPLRRIGKNRPRVVAVDPKAEHIAIAEPLVESREEAIVVRRVADGVEVHRFEPYRSPGFSQGVRDVVLTDSLLIAHTRADGEFGGGDYRLVIDEFATGRRIAETTAYVSNRTPRFVLTRDGSTLLNGSRDFELESIDTKSGERIVLTSTREELYSHFLELTLSPDERHCVAWSWERDRWVHYDRTTKTRAILEVDGWKHLVGIDAAGVAWLHRKDSLASIPLDGTGALHPRVEGEFPLAFLDASGTVLLLGDREAEDRPWRLRFLRVPR